MGHILNHDCYKSTLIADTFHQVNPKLTFKCTFAMLKLRYPDKPTITLYQITRLTMDTSTLTAKLSQQISATYARNNFREVNEKAIKEGMCIIVRKSKPVTIILSVDEYLRLKNAQEVEQAKKKPPRKITLTELRKNSTFEKYIGCMQDDYPGMTALDLQHNWYKYVD